MVTKFNFNFQELFQVLWCHTITGHVNTAYNNGPLLHETAGSPLK